MIQLTEQLSEGRDQRADVNVGLSTINDLSRPSSATVSKPSTLNNQHRVSLLTGGGEALCSWHGRCTYMTEYRLFHWSDVWRARAAGRSRVNF